MFKFTSSRSGNERLVDVNVGACMQARVEGKSWDTMYLGKAATAAERAERASQFGADCKGATLTDVRRSPEWADAAEAFAVKGGHAVDTIVNMMVYKVRGSRGPRAEGVRAVSRLRMSPAEQVLRCEQRVAVAELTAVQATELAELQAAHVRAVEELKIRHVSAMQAVVSSQSDALDSLRAEEAVREAESREALSREAERQRKESVNGRQLQAVIKRQLASAPTAARRAA